MQTDSEHRRELVQTFRSLYEPIVNELGCISCSFYSEIDNDDVMLLIEEWESKEQWKVHLKSQEFSVLLGAMSLLKDPRTLQFRLLSEVMGVQLLKKMRTTET